MIIDQLNHAACYYGLGSRIEQGLRFLRGQNLEKLPDGRIAIDGDRLYASVAACETKAAAAGNCWEAHRRYLDIQCLIAGVEKIGCADLAALKAAEPYDDARDCELFRGTGQFFIIRPGSFVVFFPQDAHLPGRAAGQPARVRKVVVKVAI